ncbi:MAG: hypothetical protein QMD46_13350 [Methanomicrobiales archaeon]|nr:hypothetical protein [Methanomicrobiales archaeon]MDI6877538.1 hypothetical protein [Methanomicrobiales archaeon]
MQLRWIEEVPPSHWEEIVKEAEGCCFFHTPAWAHIVEKTYGYRTATRLFEIDGTQVLLPMMEEPLHGIRVYHSMPFGYWGNISREGSDGRSGIRDSGERDTGQNLPVYPELPSLL